MNAFERSLNAVFISLALAFAASAHAGPVGPLKTFSAGDPAKAADVNGNFSTIVTTVNANDTRLTNVENTKQNIVVGNCLSAGAIRQINANGSVVCQNPGGTAGFVSVAAITGVPQSSATGTTVCNIICVIFSFGNAVFGRFQNSAGSDLLLVPINLPHGATITSFSFSCFRNTTTNCGATLQRDDLNAVASITTVPQATTIQTASAASINTSPAGIAVVDNVNFSYFVSMSIDGTAGTLLTPIRATVAYTLP